jgi:hypothetical protein
MENETMIDKGVTAMRQHVAEATQDKTTGRVCMEVKIESGKVTSVETKAVITDKDSPKITGFAPAGE